METEISKYESAEACKPCLKKVVHHRNNKQEAIEIEKKLN
jgi:hypothetical protein